VTARVVGIINTVDVQAVVLAGFGTDPVPCVTVAQRSPAVNAHDVRGWEVVDGPYLTGHVQARGALGITTLHMYDFDGTLFRSPLPPPAWTGDMGDWWDDPKSLAPPCVPQKPGADFWVGSTVAAAKRSLRDPEVWAMVCSGRSHQKFRTRVPELLRQQGLNFSSILLKPSASDRTWPFKKDAIETLHAKHGFERIEIWEDRHIDRFQQLIRTLGVDGEVHRLKGQHAKPLCDSV